MDIKIHEVNNKKIAEIIAEKVMINQAEDGLDLLGHLYAYDVDKLILHSEQVTPSFFDLKNGIAGEILQKFTNYRVQLAIVGDFSGYTRQSIQDFIYESNKGRQVNFLPSVEEALKRFS